MSSVTYFIGLTLLIHAAYSSFEFNQLVKTTINKQYQIIPYDIILEIIIGLIILLIASIESIKNKLIYSLNLGEDGNNKLIKPINQFLKPIKMNKAMNELNKIGINDFEEFENRIDFIDIKLKRKQYNDWINK